MTRSRSAFTLMELLTVITIIIILMGMLFPIIGMIRNHMKKVKTVQVINQIDAACSQYKSICGAYPDTKNDANSIASVFFPSGEGPGIQPVTVDTVKEADWQKVGANLLVMLQAYDRDSFASSRWPSGWITDSWNNAIRYRGVRYYPYLDPAKTTHPVDSNPPPHQDSYQLWSKGLDEKDEFGDPASDDITNWQ